MTFDSNMQEVQQVAIPELYDITAGGYLWRYTSYKTDLTFLGATYKSVAIKRSGFSIDQQIGSARVTVSGVLSTPLDKYISVSPLPSTRIQIYRAVSDALTEYALLFDGVVKGVNINNKIISGECFQSGKLRARLPHVVYQSYCNWQVFDCNCGLDATDWQEIATITIDGSNLLSNTFASFSDGYFTQGRVLFDGDFRFITNHVGNAITLQIPFGTNLVNGSSVYAYPGCDGAPDTCLNKFNNFARTCSMPYIPSHNPVIWGFK